MSNPGYEPVPHQHVPPATYPQAVPPATSAVTRRYSATGVAGRIVLSVLGAAGMIIGAFMDWFPGIIGTRLDDRAMYQTTFVSTGTFVKTVGFALIVLGLLALVGMAPRSGWLTRLAGALGVVAFVLFVIELYRAPTNTLPRAGSWVALGGGLLALIGGFMGTRRTEVARTAPPAAVPQSTGGSPGILSGDRRTPKEAAARPLGTFEAVSGRFLIRTLGCQMNEHDSERIAGLLTADGYVSTEDAANAEVVVLNTCAVRENADNRLYGQLGHLRPLKERNPRMRIVVAGCLAQKDRGIIQRRAPWVDVVIGTHALPSLLELMRRAEREGPVMDVREYTEVFPSALPAVRGDRHRAWVSVSVGCDNRCTFCIVPLVRGPQRSRSLGDILAEVESLARSGVVEVTLLGQNVNTYGRDLTVPGSGRRSRFAELLRAVDGVDGIRRIRFTSPHPHDFTPDVVEAMAGCRAVCEHIHFPMQSGSDRVLRAMNRSYRSQRYLSWVARIREAIPGIAFSTDIIVGFPGETEEDFQGTLRVVEEARFDSAYTFQYSLRPGTTAAGFEEQVPKEVVQERFDRLVETQERISLERNRDLVGRTVEVLVEGEGRKGRTQGRTRTNKIAHFDAALPPGTFAQVRVIGAHPHHLSAAVA